MLYIFISNLHFNLFYVFVQFFFFAIYPNSSVQRSNAGSTSTEPLEGNEDVEVCLLVQPADEEVDVAALPPGPPVESQVGNGGGGLCLLRRLDVEGFCALCIPVQGPWSSPFLFLKGIFVYFAYFYEALLFGQNFGAKNRHQSRNFT